MFPWPVGDDRGAAVALDGAGGVYVGGLVDTQGGYYNSVLVRKYLDGPTPSYVWENEFLPQESSSIFDMSASAAGAYVVGGWFGPYSVPYVLAVTSSTGEQFGVQGSAGGVRRRSHGRRRHGRCRVRELD